MPNPLPRSAPQAEGVDPKAVAAFIDALACRPEEELHSLMILRHGKVVAQASWKPYAPEGKHMLFSLSKSFTSTAVGFAVSEGLLSVDDPVLKFFPDEAPKNPSSKLRAMKVRHLLSMSTGHDEDTTGFMVRRRDGDWAKGFLARPVKHEPGTHFLYNTGATYMLSAIVQRLTGVTVLDYLKPRLFEPLGIEGAAWETCPRGVSTGGFGLNICVEDIAKFGQFLLQRGAWQGRQLLPAAWVDEATKKQVENGPGDGTLDWGEGYGYQFWRCVPGCYRGDGAFGQYCVVIPAMDAVVAITGGLPDMAFVLACLWKTLLPGISDGIPQDADAQAALEAKLAGLRYDPPAVSAHSPMEAELSGKAFTLEKNALRLRGIRFDFHEASCDLRLSGRKKSSVACGRGRWIEQTGRLNLATDHSIPANDRLAASFTWEVDNALLVTVRYLGSPFVLTLRAEFSAGCVGLKPGVNVSFDSREFPVIQGSGL